MRIIVDISGENEDEVYEELVGGLEDMHDAGHKFDYDIEPVDVPDTNLVNAKHHLDQAKMFLDSAAS